MCSRRKTKTTKYARFTKKYFIDKNTYRRDFAHLFFVHHWSKGRDVVGSMTCINITRQMEQLIVINKVTGVTQNFPMIMVHNLPLLMIVLIHLASLHGCRY